MKWLFFIVMLGTVLTGCSKEEDSKDSVPLTGNILTGSIEIYHNKTKVGEGSGATVELRNDNQETVRTTIAKSDGSYAFDNIPQGIYHINVLKTDCFNKGYLSDAAREKETVKYIFDRDDVVIAAAGSYKIYTKSTASITAVKWYPGKKNGKDDGVHMDIVFDDLQIPEEEAFVYIYIFAGFDESVSKYNFSRELNRENGSKIKGYVRASIPKSEIKNHQLKDYRVGSFCSWRGNFDAYKINPLPTHYAFYVTTTINSSDYFFDLGEEYSGIGNTSFVVRDYGSN